MTSLPYVVFKRKNQILNGGNWASDTYPFPAFSLCGFGTSFFSGHPFHFSLSPVTSWPYSSGSLLLLDRTPLFPVFLLLPSPSPIC